MAAEAGGNNEEEYDEELLGVGLPPIGLEDGEVVGVGNDSDDDEVELAASVPSTRSRPASYSSDDDFEDAAGQGLGAPGQDPWASEAIALDTLIGGLIAPAAGTDVLAQLNTTVTNTQAYHDVALVANVCELLLRLSVDWILAQPGFNSATVLKSGLFHIYGSLAVAAGAQAPTEIDCARDLLVLRRMVIPAGAQLAKSKDVLGDGDVEQGRGVQLSESLAHFAAVTELPRMTNRGLQTWVVWALSQLNLAMCAQATFLSILSDPLRVNRDVVTGFGSLGYAFQFTANVVHVSTATPLTLFSLPDPSRPFCRNGPVSF
jgi:hypothetical protein